MPWIDDPIVTSSEEAVDQMFAEMKRANEKMARNEEEIERLKAETNKILARLKAALIRG